VPPECLPCLAGPLYPGQDPGVQDQGCLLRGVLQLDWEGGQQPGGPAHPRHNHGPQGCRPQQDSSTDVDVLI